MIQKISALQEVTPQIVNRLIEVVNRIADIKGTAPVNVTRGAGGTQISLVERGFAAVISDRADRGTRAGLRRWRYTVEEVQPDPGTNPGLWRLVAGGRSLDTAYEWNDSMVDVGTVVWVEPWGADDWRFEFGGSLEPASSSSSFGSASTSGSGSGSGVTVVTDVVCDGGLEVTTGTLTGTVTINGRQYPVTFSVGAHGG